MRNPKKRNELTNPNTQENQHFRAPEELPEGAYGMPEIKGADLPDESGFHERRQPELRRTPDV